MREIMTSLRRNIRLAKTKNNEDVASIDNKRIKLIPKALQRDFYSVSCTELANTMLGKLLLRKINGVTLKGRIVEVEIYPGGEDKASYSHNGRRTPVNEPMYMIAGTAFVYKTYGIYHCFNISSLEEGAAVLIRAVEPLEGFKEMQEFRSVRKKTVTKVEDLCKGPSNLCTCFCITKETCNKLDMANNNEMWLEKDEAYSDEFEIIRTSRVGIGSAGTEWANKPFRFYIKGSMYVSKRDLKTEAK